MIVFSCSLDSSLAQAKFQGSLRVHEERYQLFRIFDEVVLLTQDIRGFSNELGGITHVPCAYSRSRTVRTLLLHFKFLRWLHFSYSSFLWLLRNREQVNILISENVDSPTPLLFSSLFGIPYYIHYHYDVATQIRQINKRFLEGMLLLFLEKLCFSKAVCIWVTAANLKEKAKSLGARKITLVPNWIDFNRTSKGPLKESTRQQTRIIFVGRLHPVKRVHLLIEAFGQIRKACPQAHLVIVGDGEERHNLAVLSKNLGLENDVEFLGFQNHNRVLDLMRESDMIVLPSIIEGNPRVLLEAMMLRVPIVATNVPGIRDIVKHAETGHLVSRATSEDLARAMNYVLVNRKYSARIAENAYNFAKKQFSKEQVLEKIRDDLFSTVPSYGKERIPR